MLFVRAQLGEGFCVTVIFRGNRFTPRIWADSSKVVQMNCGIARGWKQFLKRMSRGVVFPACSSECVRYLD